MKKYTVLFAFMIPLLFSCGKKADISGHVINADKKLLGLTNNTAPLRIYDTVRLDADGKFSFKFEFKNDDPVFLVLIAEKKPLATLLVEKGDKVKLETDYNNPGMYSVEGSEGSALVKELNDKALKVTASYDSLTNLLNKAENPDIQKEINKQLVNLFTKYKQDLIRFIVINNKSYASYMAMYQTLPNGFTMFGTETDLLYYKTLADSLETKHPKSFYVQKLRDDYKEMSNAIAMRNMINNAVEVTGIPEIELPDAGGNIKKLSDLQGKVVILDFWTSQDKSLLMNNMELKEIYEKYNSKGLEVYQVSLDQSRDLWLAAINNQGLKWISVCDFKGVNTQSVKSYNITQLPANFVISKSGEILARDVYGKDLEQNILKAFTSK